MKEHKHFKRALKLNRKHLVKRRRRFAVLSDGVPVSLYAHRVIERPFSSVLGPW